MSVSVIVGILVALTIADRCAAGPLSVSVAGTVTNGSSIQVGIGSVPAQRKNLAIRLTVFGTSGASLGATAVVGVALSVAGYGATTTFITYESTADGTTW